MKKIILFVVIVLMMICGHSIESSAYTSIDGGELKFNHYLTLNTNAVVPPVTFKTKIIPEEVDIPVGYTKGPSGATITPISYSASDTTYNTKQPEDDVILDAGDKYARNKITVDMTKAYFSAPGTYRYSIEGDTEGASDGVSKCTPLYLDIYVTDNGAGELQITSKFLHLKDAQDKVNSITDSYTSRYLRLVKHVTGNQGNREKEFTFKIKVTDDSPLKQYNVVLPDGTSKMITSGVESTFNIKHSNQIYIYGISKSDKYCVTENDYESEGYKTSYSVSGGERKPGRSTGDTVMELTNDYVVFQNNKNNDEPITGIISSRLPYILMVVFSVGFCFLLFYKKGTRISR